MLLIKLLLFDLQVTGGVAEAEVRKLGSALGPHTGQEEGEATSQLFQWLSILLMKGNSELFLNKTRFDQDDV